MTSYLEVCMYNKLITWVPSSKTNGVIAGVRFNIMDVRYLGMSATWTASLLNDSGPINIIKYK